MPRRPSRSGLIAAGVHLLWQAAPGLACAAAVVVVCGAAVSSLLILATGALVGTIPAAAGAGLGSAAGNRLMLALGGFALLAVLQMLLASLESTLSAVLRLRVARTVDDRVISASLRPSDIAGLERPEHADRVRLATDELTRPDLVAQSLAAVTRPRLQALVLVAILAHFAWWAPVILATVATLTYRQYLRISTTVHASMAAAAEVIRRSGYFRSIAVDPDPAKEVRLFGLGNWVVGRMTSAWRTGMTTIWAHRRADMRPAYLTMVVLVMAEALVLVKLALDAAHGQIGVAALVVYAQAAIALPLLGWVGDPDYQFRQGLLGLHALTQLDRLGGGELAHPGDVTLRDDQPRHDLVLDGVHFAYPGADRNALDGLSLRIPAGSSVAIVGANGAGKTTLIKLLTRLYDPDRGRISVDGIDLRDLEPGAWRRRLAVVFQDFVRYPLPLRANVGFGDPSVATDQDALDHALAMAGGGSLPSSLPAGWDTVLSSQHGGGDLSGGQWQRVALARALLAMRTSSVLILDEPTANLDVRAEAELFERLLGLTGDRTTILISHRFSSVRKADLIYVLDRGRVAEAGSHTELMARDGLYAGMFRTQAARFVQDGDSSHLVPTPDTSVDPGPAVTHAHGDPQSRSEPSDPPPQPRHRDVHGTLPALRMLLTGAFGESRRLAALGFLLVPAAAVLSSLQAVWFQRMVDGATQLALGITVVAALLLAATRGAWRALALVGTTTRIALSERVGFAFDRSLAEDASSIPGLHHLESTAFLDRLHTLRTRLMGMSGLLNWLLNLLEDLGGFLIAAVLLALVHPLLLVVPIVGLATLRLQIAGQLLASRSEDAAAADYRLSRDLCTLATSPSAAKEIRVFGVGRQLRTLQQDARRRADRVVEHAQWRVGAIGAAGGLLTTVSMVTAVGAVARLTATGAVSLGAVLLAVMLASRLVEHMAGLVMATGMVVDLLRSAERLHWLHAYARRVRPHRPTAPVPKTLRHGITFDAVGFRYASATSNALHDISVHLPAGSVVALVGQNGAGKTTLVKLLCRYYEPTTGQIRVDGAGLDELDVHHWRASLGAAFQDFVRFELLVGEAVGIGDLPRLDDHVAISHSLDRAGAAELAPALPLGLDTQLGTQWDAGVDLSSGQWQKLALGRALMRRTPLVLLLDEPTAMLDAHTEHALFERFSAAARAGRRTGTITVLISHRFSTVRMADLIIVLDDGSITEIGTHEQLLAKRGKYADLYELQAHSYRETNR